MYQVVQALAPYLSCPGAGSELRDLPVQAKARRTIVSMVFSVPSPFKRAPLLRIPVFPIDLKEINGRTRASRERKSKARGAVAGKAGRCACSPRHHKKGVRWTWVAVFARRKQPRSHCDAHSEHVQGNRRIALRVRKERPAPIPRCSE